MPGYRERLNTLLVGVGEPVQSGKKLFALHFGKLGRGVEGEGAGTSISIPVHSIAQVIRDRVIHKGRGGTYEALVIWSVSFRSPRCPSCDGVILHV